MRRPICIFCTVLFLSGCLNPSGRKVQLQHQSAATQLFIQPLGTIDTTYSNFLQQQIPQYFRLHAVVITAAALPSSAFYIPRQRFIADSLLLFLNTRSANKNEYVLGLTAKDIATAHHNVANWGVMGLGYRPGNAAVVSIFRISGHFNKQQICSRLLKLALHELGHNFGLDHCADQHCIMVDAEGKNKLDGTEHFCKNCTIFLQKKKIL